MLSDSKDLERTNVLASLYIYTPIEPESDLYFGPATTQTMVVSYQKQGSNGFYIYIYSILLSTSRCHRRGEGGVEVDVLRQLSLKGVAMRFASSRLH